MFMDNMTTMMHACVKKRTKRAKSYLGKRSSWILTLNKSGLPPCWKHHLDLFILEALNGLFADKTSVTLETTHELFDSSAAKECQIGVAKGEGKEDMLRCW
jgi:hypothetical protein